MSWLTKGLKKEIDNENHASAVSCFVVSACLAGTVWAQHAPHMIVTPNDLKWEDVAALPPGAKIAVIEGKMNQEGPSRPG